MATPFTFPPGMRASDIFKLGKTPSDFVLPGFVSGTVGALIAPGSTGKSMLAMELAAIVAGANILGENWAPKRTGEVVILAVEDPQNELFNRWIDLGKSLSAKEQAAGSKVLVVPMFGKQFDIMNPDCFSALVELCKGKRLLILDTFRRIHLLDENSSGDMAQVVGRLEEFALLTGCAVLFLHHTSKSAAMNGQGGEQQASRGSSVLVDNIRFQMFMTGMNAESVKAEKLNVNPEDFKRYVKLGVSKVNYGPKLGEVWLTRCDGGILKPVDEFEFSKIAEVKRLEREFKEDLKEIEAAEAAEFGRNSYQDAKDGYVAPQQKPARKTAMNFNGGRW